MAEQFSSHPGHGSARKTANSFQAGFVGTAGGGSKNISESRDNQGAGEAGAQIAFARRPGMGTGQAVQDAHRDHPGFKHGDPRMAK